MFGEFLATVTGPRSSRLRWLHWLHWFYWGFRSLRRIRFDRRWWIGIVQFFGMRTEMLLQSQIEAMSKPLDLGLEFAIVRLDFDEFGLQVERHLQKLPDDPLELKGFIRQSIDVDTRPLRLHPTPTRGVRKKLRSI